MSETMFEGVSEQGMWVPVATIDLSSQDPTNMKLLYDNFHSQAQLLGLSLEDYDKDYQIQVEEGMGMMYLVLSLSVGYYELTLEREALMSEGLYYANPGLENLH